MIDRDNNYSSLHLCYVNKDISLCRQDLFKNCVPHSGHSGFAVVLSKAD